MLSRVPSIRGSDMDISGRIHSVETFGALDGPGIRYVIFFQGCPLRCVYCHNPDSWHSRGGRIVTARELVEEAASYRAFIKNGGVTLSGGEPMMQPAFAEEILRGVHGYGLHTAVDTSGSLPVAECRGVLSQTDLVLLDIKSADAGLCRRITGADNSNALALLDYCGKNGIEVWLRHVIVPGLTDSEDSVSALGRLARGKKWIKRVELLPFHKMGEYKWNGIGAKYTLSETKPPDDSVMSRLRRLLERTMSE
jgi:pyruvate formate lyase activating enzyme